MKTATASIATLAHGAVIEMVDDNLWPAGSARGPFRRSAT